MNTWCVNCVFMVWFYAHFSIADFPDPKDRMVQVVRWYMSSYHAGRKSSVAKKPYNPILGEVFKCHWDIPGLPADSSSLVTDGPVPWCTKNQLTFVAEQVSHHPPSKSISCISKAYTVYHCYACWHTFWPVVCLPIEVMLLNMTNVICHPIKVRTV